MAAFAKSWRREVVVEGGDRGGSNQHRATEAGATSIVPPLNRRTARSRRVIVPFTHLAREGRMTVTIGRRELLAALGGAAAAWPIAPRAQQSSMPVIGFLNSETPIGFAPQAAAFRQGVSEAGYVEGENVAIVYRWADNQVGRLPELAAELVRLEVAVFATTGGVAPALAAKATTTTIPIVFMVGEDPVNLGLVASLARPNGNLTGINFFNSELVAKRLELLRELVPAATRVAVLVNPANAANAETTLRDVEAAARVIGLQIQVLNASTNREISAAFTTLVRQRSDVPFVGNDAFFATRRVQIAILAARHAVPAVYAQRDFAEAGGLMSYGSSITDAFRQVGAYTSKCCPLCRRKRTSDLCVNETRPDLTQRFQKSTRKWPGRSGVRFIALSRSLCVSAAGSGSVCIRQSLRLAG